MSATLARHASSKRDAFFSLPEVSRLTSAEQSNGRGLAFRIARTVFSVIACPTGVLTVLIMLSVTGNVDLGGSAVGIVLLVAVSMAVVSSIQDAAEQVAVSSGELSRSGQAGAVQEAARALQSVEEMSRSISAAEQMSVSTSRLSARAQELRRLVAQFRIGAAQPVDTGAPAATAES